MPEVMFASCWCARSATASAWSNRSGDSGDREALIERETSNT